MCSKIFKPQIKTSKYCSLLCSQKGLKGRVFSPEHCKKISDYAKTRTGKKNPMYGRKAAHGKGKWHVSWTGERNWLRSSWESKYAEYLDLNKIEYKVEPKAFEIEYDYLGDKKEGTYRPDFYLVEDDAYIEIKGWWRDDAKYKFEAFIKRYPTIRLILIEKNNLKEMGIDI